MARKTDERRLLTAALIDQGQVLTAAMTTLFQQMVTDGHGRLAERALAQVALEGLKEDRR